MTKEIDERTKTREAEERARKAESALKEEEGRSWKRAGITSAVVAAIIVFGGQFWPGYQLDSSAEKMAVDRTEVAVKAVATNILPALCASKAKSDPDAAKLTEVAALTSPSQQASKISDTEWVNFEGLTLSSVNKRALADSCQKLLFPPTEAAKTTG